MKKALILIDIQKDYFEGGRKMLVGADEAVGNAKSVLEKCRKENIDIIHVQHINYREGATFFLPDTEGIEIHPYVAPLPDEKVITKDFPNSFRETELLSYLQERGINALIICGMMTHMCIDTTVRAARDLGFMNLLIGDACATLDLQIEDKFVKAADVHYAFLAALNRNFCQVVNSNDYINDNIE